MQAQSARPGWETKQVYVLSAICLLLGAMLGYLLRGSASPQPPAVPAAHQTHANGPGVPGHSGLMPTLEQMKHMADTQAEPLLAKMRANPNDASVLIQIGNVYRSAHQFKDATDYYSKALQLDPRNVAIRTELASCLYYTGDADGALAQLRQALQTDPKDSNSLFNLGVIEWREKKDAASAIAAWNQLLKSNPSLAAEKRTQVQKLIAEVKEQSKAVKN
ncbi:MAG TPA: tetratricopeptide repeat protein [Terriglobales bacterium]|nr:tetratricopeptide repeat protein [Terriglobales bacterium]